MVELIDLACGESDGPAEPAICRLTQALSLLEERPLERAGYSQAADASLQEAAVRFAARLEPAQQLSTEEHEAMQEFVRCLAKCEDEWKRSWWSLFGEERHPASLFCP